MKSNARLNRGSLAPFLILQELTFLKCIFLFIQALAIMNVICAMIFGSRYDLEDEEFKDILHANVTFIRAFEYDMLVDIFPILRLLPNRKIKMIKEALGIRDPILERKLKEHRDQFDGETVNDMTDALLKAAQDAINEDKDVKQYLTDEHLLKIMDDMFGAGLETTTTTVRWGMLYLTHWPEVQDKAYKYLMNVVGQDRLPTYDDKPSLPYLEAVVHEILRMGCIAPFAVPHKATKDATLSGFDIPKNTQVRLYNLLSSLRLRIPCCRLSLHLFLIIR